MKDNKKIKIFFSYSSQNKEYLKLLKNFLKSIDLEDNINYFDYVERNENTSNSNYAKIHHQITQSDYFISILTENYLKSTLCCWEAGLAFRENQERKKFNMIAMIIPRENILELERTFDQQFIFNKEGLTSLISYISSIKDTMKFSKFRINNNLENLQKQTEKIFIEKIILDGNYSEVEKIKLKNLY